VTWKESLEQLGFDKFAKRVEQNSGQVYDETICWFHLVAPGGVLLLIVGPMAVLDLAAHRELYTPFELQVVGIGLPLFVPGLARWWFLRRRHSFFGIGRKQLAKTLTWLDLKVHGVENPGPITDNHCPPEYIALGLQDFYANAMRYAVLRSITRLGSEIPWSTEDARRIGSRLSSAEAAMAVAGMSGFVVFTTLSYFGPMSSGNPNGFWIPFLVLAVPCLALTLWAVVRWSRTKSSDPPWLKGTMVGLDVQPIDTLTPLLSLLAAKCQSPLRVLVLGDYPELTYTGRVYMTNRGFQLKEAIFIPSSGMVENP